MPVGIHEGRGKSKPERGVKHWFELIEFRLFWDGHVNCRDLMEAFGGLVNQPSTDLNRYSGLTAYNMFYDKSAKNYARGSNFLPLFRNSEDVALVRARGGERSRE